MFGFAFMLNTRFQTGPAQDARPRYNAMVRVSSPRRQKLGATVECCIARGAA
jgi:hypothetical protein